MSVNIEIVLLTAGVDAEPSTYSQWFWMTARPGYVVEARVRRCGCRRLELYGCRVLLRKLVLRPADLALHSREMVTDALAICHYVTGCSRTLRRVMMV